MKRFLVAGTLIVSVFLGAIVAIGVADLTSDEAQAAACRCPKIYAPVICDNGKVYPNQCVADCRHARNCEPYGLP